MLMSASDPPVVIETGHHPDATVIWLHGLGADGHDFEPIIPALGLPASLSLRFIFPHAPVMPVSINGGMQMRAWYDLIPADTETGMRSDAAGIRGSSAYVHGLIAEQVAGGIDVGRIILAGFSQGGVIALHTGLRCDKTLGGIMALSTYLGLPETLAAEADSANKVTPIFMAHGTGDEVLPMAMGARSRDALIDAGYDVAWHEYAMPHSVCPEEIADISRWLQLVLS